MANKPTIDRHRNPCIPVRCDKDTYDTISKIATEKNLPMSDIVRSLIQDGLKVQGYIQDEDYLRQMVFAAVQEALKPSVDRLASIGAKNTQIAAASFFMNTYAAAAALPQRERTQVETAAGQAREMGIQYLRLGKERDIDTFIKQGTGEMISNLGTG